MSKKVKYNREVLKWARTSAKVSLEKVAKTISKSCSEERIKEWESADGMDAPSENQLKKLAKLYRRPIEAFSLNYVPKEYPKLKDFRKDKQELSTAAIFMMREIQEKQEWLRNFYIKSRKSKRSFVGRFTVKSDPQKVAADIRKTLGVNISANKQKPLRYWTDKIENQGVFIAMSSNFHTRLKLDSDIFKCFAIADPYAPFIFINSEDWDHGQLFSLIHALVHVWIGVSGISNDTGIPQDTGRLHPVERFCNDVAHRVLMAIEDLKLFLPDKSETLPKHIAKAGRKLGLSQKSIILQADHYKLINATPKNDLLKSADDSWKEFLRKEESKPKSSGGPNYYIMQLRRNSRSFVNVVMDTLKNGRISGPDASRLLNVREVNFAKFERYLYK